ncbi:hypothetical protein EJB05_38165, partial [Eragrostis curvula]
MDLFPSTASSSSSASSAPEQRRQCYGLGSAACGLAGRVLCGMVTCVFAAGTLRCAGRSIELSMTEQSVCDSLTGIIRGRAHKLIPVYIDEHPKTQTKTR